MNDGLVGREAFFAPAERHYTEVEIPDFGRVRLQSLTEREAARYDSYSVTKKGIDPRRVASARRRLIALCVVDEFGNRLLTDEDSERLGALPSHVAEALYRACDAHCETGATIEELEGN